MRRAESPGPCGAVDPAPGGTRHLAHDGPSRREPREPIRHGRRRRAAPPPPLAQRAVATVGGRRVPPRHRQPRRLVRRDGSRSQPSGRGGLWARPPWVGPQPGSTRPPRPLRAGVGRRGTAGAAGRCRAPAGTGLPGRLQLGGQARGGVRRPAARAAGRAAAARPRPAPPGQPVAVAPGAGRGRAPGAPDGPPAHPADAGAVHRQPALPGLHPGRPAPAAGGHHPVLLADGSPRPPAGARHGPPSAPGAPAPGRGRPDGGRTGDPPLVRWARRPALQLPGLSGGGPHPGLRAGPDTLSGGPAGLAVGHGAPPAPRRLRCRR